MATRDEIIHIADELIRDSGFHSFSYTDIGRRLGIRNASIHYYFPTKTELGVAVIQQHIDALVALKSALEHADALQKLRGVIQIYAESKRCDQVCLVGALSTALHSIEEPMKTAIQQFAQLFLDWVTEILLEGREKEIFHFNAPPRVKAMLLITNLLAALQLTRLTEPNDFNIITDTIVTELTA